MAGGRFRQPATGRLLPGRSHFASNQLHLMGMASWRPTAELSAACVFGARCYFDGIFLGFVVPVVVVVVVFKSNSCVSLAAATAVLFGWAAATINLDQQEQHPKTVIKTNRAFFLVSCSSNETKRTSYPSGRTKKSAKARSI